MVRLNSHFHSLHLSTPIINRALPEWLPFHPHKWWIHVRNVYIPMSYLYGVRYQMEENDLILSLREVSIFPDVCFLPSNN